MSKVKIEGHGTGTGTFTVTTPSSNTDRTITLPDSTGTLATTADTFNPDAAVTINESGADVDFRVESDTNTHALFVQGSDGNVGIGTTAPILGKVHLLAAGTSDASMENVAHFGKNSTSRAGLQIRANATQVDVGLQAQAGAGNLDLSFSTLVGGGHYERMRLLSAGGLTFNGDTAAANALNDYEEGTWTPSFNGTGGASGQVYTDQSGHYTKIGNKCFCSCNLQLSTKGTITGFVKISGMPFTVASGTAAANAGATTYAHKWDLDTGHTLEVWIYNTNTIYLTQTAFSGDAPTQLATGHMQNTTGVKVTFSYTTT